MALAGHDLALLTARFGVARFGASRFGFIPCPEDVEGTGAEEPGEYIWKEDSEVVTEWTLANEDCACRDLCTLVLGSAAITPLCQIPDQVLTFTSALSGVLGQVEGIARVAWGDSQHDEQQFSLLENGDIVFTHAYNDPGTYDAILTVWDERECSISRTRTITIAVAMVATASADPELGSVGEEIDFAVNITGGVAPYTYLWNFGTKPYLGKVPTTSYWSQDEDTGSDRVDVVGGHDLTPMNAPTAVQGAFGQASHFSTDQWLGVAHHADLQGGATDLSVSVWVNVDTPTIDQYGIIGIGQDEWKLIVSGFGSLTNYFRFFWFNADMTLGHTFGSEVVLGEWQFLTAWRDQATGVISLRVDFGETFTDDTVDGNVGTNLFAIGSYVTSGSPGKFLEGSVDEAYVYRGLWSDEEKRNLAGMSELADPTWQFSEAGTFSVSVTVTDSRGCTATDTIDITVAEAEVAIVTGVVADDAEPANLFVGAEVFMTVDAVPWPDGAAITDSDGVYVFADVPAGEIIVTCDDSGYSGSNTDTFTPPGTLELDIVMVGS